MSSHTPASQPPYNVPPTDVEGFDSLAELALDMRWSWHHAADQVWRQLDPVQWELTHKKPRHMIPVLPNSWCSKGRLRQSVGSPLSFPPAKLRRQAATVNRRFAALRVFFRWAKGTGLISELPTESVKEVPAAPRSPKALAKRKVDRLIREAERHGQPRNIAIVQLLRHTGIRVGELCNLRLGDIDSSERRGLLLVRAGKGRQGSHAVTQQRCAPGA